MGTDYSGSLDPSDSQGRLCDPLRSQTSPFSSSHRSDIETPFSPRSGSIPSGQKGSRKGNGSDVSRVLQPSLLSSEEERPVSTCHRSVQTQRVLGQSIFQDGDSSFHPGFHQTVALGCFFGPFGCLLPRPYSPQMQEVPSLLLRRSGPSVPGHALRTGNSPQSFYQTHGGGRSIPPTTGDSTSSVLRRLASSSSQPSPSPPRPRVFLVQDSVPGSPTQPGQVGADSDSGLCVCRDELPYSLGSSQSTTCSISRSGEPSDTLRSSFSSHSKRVSFLDRNPQCSSGFGSLGKTSSSTDTILPISSLVSDSWRSQGIHSNRCTATVSPSLVDQPRPSTSRGSPIPSSSEHSVDHGCQSSRLGCSPRTTWTYGSGTLVSTGISSPHKQFGDESSSVSYLTLPNSPAGTMCPHFIRQHHGGLLHQETGRNSFPITVSGDSSPLRPVRVSSSNRTDQIHTRPVERPSGRSLQVSSTSPIRMVSSSGSCPSDFQGVGSSDVRLVCHTSEPSTSTVCQSSAGSSSVGDRRAHVRLDKNGRICLSPLQPHHAGSREGSSQPSLPCSSGGTMVAPKNVAQRSPRSTQRSSKGSSSKARPSNSKRSVAHQPRHVPSTRLAIIQQSLRKRRFSERASSLISASRRQSTNIVYEAKWRVFACWCSRRKINPLDPSPRRLADFFVYLFDVKNLSISTIKGYRSTISNTLAFHKKSKVCHDPAIVELIKSLELKRPICRSLTPKWDLSCVLWSLTKTPYEPLDQASLKHLTWKTVFLLTLASAKRRSEIHALSAEEGHIRFHSSDGSVTLLCQTGFLAKTQLPSMAPQPFSIPSLSKHCGRDDSDRTLCPVRALKFYLNKVKSLRNGRLRLFIPLKGGGDVSAASISRWIASTIKLAYSSLSERDLTSLRIRPHEVRALSTSWAFVNHTPLADILNAAFWKSPSTFSAFYLRSFQCQRDNLYLLGPTVVAQSVISNTSFPNTSE